MYFLYICVEEADLHVLLLCHLEGPPSASISLHGDLIEVLMPNITSTLLNYSGQIGQCMNNNSNKGGTPV